MGCGKGLVEVGEEELRAWRNNEMGEGRSLSYGGMEKWTALKIVLIYQSSKVLHTHTPMEAELA